MPKTSWASIHCAVEYNYTIDAIDLSVGVYILRIQIDGDPVAADLIKQ